MASKYATPEIQRRAHSARGQMAIHTRRGNVEAVRAARSDLAQARLESVIQEEAGYLDEDRLNRLADLMFEVDPE